MEMVTNPECRNDQIMDMNQRQRGVIAEFAGLGDWEDRYKRLIDIGKALPELPDDKKVEDFKVKGCQSQVWIHARLEQGRVIFEADSDALLVRGLVALLLRVILKRHSPRDLGNSTRFHKRNWFRVKA